MLATSEEAREDTGGRGGGFLQCLLDTSQVNREGPKGSCRPRPDPHISETAQEPRESVGRDFGKHDIGGRACLGVGPDFGACALSAGRVNK